MDTEESDLALEEELEDVAELARYMEMHSGQQPGTSTDYNDSPESMEELFYQQQLQYLQEEAEGIYVDEEPIELDEEEEEDETGETGLELLSSTSQLKSGPQLDYQIAIPNFSVNQLFDTGKYGYAETRPREHFGSSESDQEETTIGQIEDKEKLNHNRDLPSYVIQKDHLYRSFLQFQAALTKEAQRRNPLTFPLSTLNKKEKAHNPKVFLTSFKLERVTDKDIKKQRKIDRPNDETLSSDSDEHNEGEDASDDSEEIDEDVEESTSSETDSDGSGDSSDTSDSSIQQSSITRKKKRVEEQHVPDQTPSRTDKQHQMTESEKVAHLVNAMEAMSRRESADDHESSSEDNDEGNGHNEGKPLPTHVGSAPINLIGSQRNPPTKAPSQQQQRRRSTTKEITKDTAKRDSNMLATLFEQKDTVDGKVQAQDIETAPFYEEECVLEETNDEIQRREGTPLHVLYDKVEENAVNNVTARQSRVAWDVDVSVQDDDGVVEDAKLVQDGILDAYGHLYEEPITLDLDVPDEKVLVTCCLADRMMSGRYRPCAREASDHVFTHNLAIQTFRKNIDLAFRFRGGSQYICEFHYRLITISRGEILEEEIPYYAQEKSELEKILGVEWEKPNHESEYLHCLPVPTTAQSRRHQKRKKWPPGNPPITESVTDINMFFNSPPSPSNLSRTNKRKYWSLKTDGEREHFLRKAFCPWTMSRCPPVDCPVFYPQDKSETSSISSVDSTIYNQRQLLRLEDLDIRNKELARALDEDEDQESYHSGATGSHDEDPAENAELFEESDGISDSSDSSDDISDSELGEDGSPIVQLEEDKGEDHGEEGDDEEEGEEMEVDTLSVERRTWPTKRERRRKRGSSDESEGISDEPGTSGLGTSKPTSVYVPRRLAWELREYNEEEDADYDPAIDDKDSASNSSQASKQSTRSDHDIDYDEVYHLTKEYLELSGRHKDARIAAAHLRQLGVQRNDTVRKYAATRERVEHRQTHSKEVKIEDEDRPGTSQQVATSTLRLTKKDTEGSSKRTQSVHSDKPSTSREAQKPSASTKRKEAAQTTKAAKSRKKALQRGTKRVAEEDEDEGEQISEETAKKSKNKKGKGREESTDVDDEELDEKESEVQSKSKRRSSRKKAKPVFDLKNASRSKQKAAGAQQKMKPTTSQQTRIVKEQRPAEPSSESESESSRRSSATENLSWEPTEMRRVLTEHELPIPFQEFLLSAIANVSSDTSDDTDSEDPDYQPPEESTSSHDDSSADEQDTQMADTYLDGGQVNPQSEQSQEYVLPEYTQHYQAIVEEQQDVPNLEETQAHCIGGISIQDAAGEEYLVPEELANSELSEQWKEEYQAQLKYYQSVLQNYHSEGVHTDVVAYMNHYYQTTSQGISNVTTTMERQIDEESEASISEDELRELANNDDEYSNGCPRLTSSPEPSITVDPGSESDLSDDSTDDGASSESSVAVTIREMSDDEEDVEDEENSEQEVFYEVVSVGYASESDEERRVVEVYSHPDHIGISAGECEEIGVLINNQLEAEGGDDEEEDDEEYEDEEDSEEESESDEEDDEEDEEGTPEVETVQPAATSQDTIGASVTRYRGKKLVDEDRATEIRPVKSKSSRSKRFPESTSGGYPDDAFVQHYEEESYDEPKKTAKTGKVSDPPRKGKAEGTKQVDKEHEIEELSVDGEGDDETKIEKRHEDIEDGGDEESDEEESERLRELVRKELGEDCTEEEIDEYIRIQKEVANEYIDYLDKQSDDYLEDVERALEDDETPRTTTKVVNSVFKKLYHSQQYQEYLSLIENYDTVKEALRKVHKTTTRKGITVEEADNGELYEVDDRDDESEDEDEDEEEVEDEGRAEEVEEAPEEPAAEKNQEESPTDGDEEKAPDEEEDENEDERDEEEETEKEDVEEAPEPAPAPPSPPPPPTQHKEDEDEQHASGLSALPAATLRRYMEHFKIPTDPGATRTMMLDDIIRHFNRLPVDANESIPFFLFAIRNESNALDQQEQEPQAEQEAQGGQANTEQTSQAEETAEGDQDDGGTERGEEQDEEEEEE